MASERSFFFLGLGLGLKVSCAPTCPGEMCQIVEPMMRDPMLTAAYNTNKNTAAPTATATSSATAVFLTADATVSPSLSGVTPSNLNSQQKLHASKPR